jgi:cellulose synthase/poly-beta-1,6-N-acetylglucosamine synthase-like glycosyltransferase
MTAVFWVSLVLLVYVYAAYPVLVLLLGFLVRRGVRTEPIAPPVSILIAAHNEAACLRTTLENKLSLEYPADNREIIVVSDGSSDGTDTIGREFEARGVTFMRQEPRQGKTAALNLAAGRAKGEVLVFSDANSIYARDALRNLVASFGDASVGYVTGRLVYTQSESVSPDQGTSFYMRVENALRLAETRLGSVVGVNGGIDAVRRSLYTPMRADQLPDFVLPLHVIERGYRVVYNPSATSFEPALRDRKDEYRMRVRVSLRALHGLADMVHVFDVRRFGLFSWQLLSHKLLRYLAFIPLILLFCSSLLLASSGGVYASALVFQIVAYLLAVLPLLRPRRLSSLPVRLAHYFLLLNAACAHATYLWCRGETRVVWSPRKG